MSTVPDKFQRRLEAGQILFRQGDPGQEAYVIESGAIEIYTESPNGRSKIAELGPEDILGEMALAGDQTRTACAAAVIPTVLSVITHERLSDKLVKADPMLRHLLRVTMARSRDSLRRARGEQESAPAAPVSVVDRDLALLRLRLEQDIERALEAGEFRLNYQPIVRLSDGSVAGFESLIRWVRADGNQIPPDRFIGIAEESGLIVAIGHWIIRQACADLKKLDAFAQSANRPPLFVNINLSIRQFADPELIPVLQDSFAQQGLQAARIKLEITESLVMGNMDAALELMHKLKGIGCRLAVDDFGTGYSSLSYLHKLPVDVLKLDRSFIREINGNSRAAVLVHAVARLARDLGMETVVEGVETMTQVQACRDADVHYAQGWHYSPALPLEKAIEFLGKIVL